MKKEICDFTTYLKIASVIYYQLAEVCFEVSWVEYEGLSVSYGAVQNEKCFSVCKCIGMAHTQILTEGM